MGMGRVVEGQGKSCRRKKGELKRGMGTTAEGQGVVKEVHGENCQDVLSSPKPFLQFNDQSSGEGNL